jgi:MFS family permease
MLRTISVLMRRAIKPMTPTQMDTAARRDARTQEGREYRITFTLCAVEILGLIGIAAFPALLPTFVSQWQLTNTEAGWISAVYYLGYMLAVPILVGLTDRVDARIILAIGAAVGSLSSLGFALCADGFLTAAALRFVTGISLAGIYMPGLKIVSDTVDGPLQSRFVSFYTASFSIGLSLSFFFAGEINRWLNWRWAFGFAALCAVGALAVTRIFVPAAATREPTDSGGFLVDFRPVLRAKEALSYILAYGAHMWELFGMRSWLVAFLHYSRSLQPSAAEAVSATQIAFLVTLIGLPASIGGNELARHIGRKKLITTVMICSTGLCAVIGFTASLPYALVAGLCLLHGITVVGDSAALTAGAVAAAPAGCRGATLALHSTVGFGAAFLGPLAVGMVLDAFAGSPSTAWGMGFLCMGLGCAAGPAFLARLGRR